MRLLVCMPLSLLTALAAIAQSSTQPKPSWTWSSEERIALRLNPVAIRERLVQHEFRQNPNASALQAVASTTVIESATFVIDGASDPALFLPWELMERLLNSTDSSNPGSEMLRQRYTDDIVAAGWSTTSFWSDFDDIAWKYMKLRNEAARFPRRTMYVADGSASRPRLEIEQAFCGARTEALERARETFGAVQFDRFLYEAVAPTITVYSDDPMTHNQLRWIEGGCR